jgi:hypothetical protein
MDWSPENRLDRWAFVFTLDEALDYFIKMKEIQNLIEAQERKEQEA